MKTYGIAYITTGLVFLAIDAIWLTVAAQRLYRPLIGDMLVEKFRLTPAALFYLLYIAGIVVFAIAPAIASGRWATALVKGALFGLFAYATYDLTNQATLKNWSTTIRSSISAGEPCLTAVAATAWAT